MTLGQEGPQTEAASSVDATSPARDINDAKLRQLAETLALPNRFAFYILVTEFDGHLGEARRMCRQLGTGPGVVVSPYRTRRGERRKRALTDRDAWPSALLQVLMTLADHAPRGPVWLDASSVPSPAGEQRIAADDDGWAALLRAMNQRRNALSQTLDRPLVFVCPLRLLRRLAHEAPDLWSVRSETVYLALPPLPQGIVPLPAEVARERANLSSTVLLERLEHARAALADARARFAIARRPAHLDAVRAALSATVEGLLALGRPAEALPLAQEAVECARDLVALVGDAALPSLVEHLGELGSTGVALGDVRIAFDAASEGVEIARHQLRRDPDQGAVGLAGMLNNLANILAAQGRFEQALATAEESLAVAQRMSEQTQRDNRPLLAALLSSLAVRLVEVGRLAEAHETAHRAVAAIRSLSESGLAPHAATLAVALNNLANLQGQLGDVAGAIASSSEAVAVLRELVGRNPKAFGPDLAMALHGVSLWLEFSGRTEEALRAARDSVAMYREMTEPMRVRNLHGWSVALMNLARQQFEANQPHLALQTAEEAYPLCQSWLEAAPIAGALPFARSSGAYATILLGCGEPGKAARAFAEGASALLTAAGPTLDAHHDVLRSLTEGHVQACDAAGAKVDEKLLERAARALASDEVTRT
ncbi:MAG: tetratricopeptide repeat-containing protein [Deltaproteobacteria bacterium]|nr:tetratricopeptide repeat-containing protein [Deltaproteobacteria bacterium]